MREGRSAIVSLLSSMRETCFSFGQRRGTPDVIARHERSSMSSVYHYRSPCREATPPFVINKPPVNEQLKGIRLAVLLVVFVSLFELWSLNPVKLSAETLCLHTLFLHASAAAAEAGTTRDEALGGETLQQQYSPAEGDDGEAPNAVQHVHSGKAPPGEGDGQERTDFFDESNDVTSGMTKPQTKSPIVPISGRMPGVAGVGEGEVPDSPDQTEPSAPQHIISVPADASESAVADAAATSNASASVPPSASLAVSSPLPLVAFAQISAYPSATVLPSVTASFPGSFNSLASVAVPSLLTDTLASFPLFSTVVERKKLAESSCIGVNGCNNNGSRSINTGSSSSSGASSSSNGCGGVPCALEVLSLLDSTSAMEWPLMPSVVLQGIGKTVDKVVRGFVLRTAQVLPNIKRNVIISYKGYKPFKLLEMLQLRNHFLEHLSAFFYSLQPLRSIYLRHLGMEIFELPDVLGIADFIRAALGLRQYVEHVYEDQELTDFDWEPAETAENEEAFPWVAAPSTFPLRDVPHNHSAKNLPLQKKQSGTGSSTGGVDTSGYSAVGPVSAERHTSETDKTGAGGGISHKGERKDEAANHGDAASTADGERAPPRRLQVMPNDPLTWRQWPISDNGRLRWGTEAPKAWEIWNGSRLPESITVAVIDSGVNYNHPDLRNMIWTNPDEICNNGIDDDRNGLIDDCIGWDFINGDNDPDDDNGHGTASAGIIAAEPNNNIGMAGICWKCNIMSLKALNQNIKGTVSSFARAIDYALGKGVKISNNSYGGRGSGFHGLEQAVVRARAAGMIFVAAAGNYNGNNDNDRDPVYPASYPLDNIVSVAAITRAGTLANFSSYGRTQVDIAAPGAQIMSTSLHGTYRTLDGTSFAVPFVTGAVALIWSRFPQLTYQEVIARILRNAKPNPHLQVRDPLTTSSFRRRNLETGPPAVALVLDVLHLLHEKDPSTVLGGYIATSGVIDIWKALTNGADTLSSPAPPFSALPHPPPPSPIQPLPPQFSCGNLICHPVASCVISAEGPLCQCPTGYEGSGVECRDIDECTFSPCGPASVCKNLPGSFECLCREGFRQVGDTCVDINECAEGVLDEDGNRNQIACPAVALCQNFSGSFDCICPPRSLWNGKSGSKAQCLTLNIPITGPCVDNGGCGINALCQASGSAWYHQRTCTCVEGYEKFGSSAQSAMHLRQIQLLGDGRDACIRKGLLDLEISRYLSLWEVFFWPKLGATVPPQVPKDTGSPVSPRDEDLGGAAAVQQTSGLPRPAPAGLTAAASSTPGLSAAALQEGGPNTATPHVKTVNIVEEVTGHSSTLSSSRGSAPALREILPSGGPSAISSSSPPSVNNTSTAADEANSSRLASSIVGSFYAAAGWLRPRGPSVTVYNQALTCFLGLCLLGGTETTGSHQAV